MSSYAPIAGVFCPLTLRQMVVRAAVLMAMVSGLAACSAMPEWSKPDAIYGDTAAAPTPAGTTGFPDLADTPDKKPAVTSTADRKALAESLEKDRARSREGDKDLRKGAAPSSAVTPLAKLKADEAAAMNAIPDSGAVAPVQKTATVAPAVPARVAETSAPVEQADAPAPAPTPTPVKQAAAPAPAPAAPAPVKQAAAPVAAPVVAPVMVDAAKADATGADVTADTAVISPPAETASPLEPGVIPMPPRGGHKTYAEARSEIAKFMDDAHDSKMIIDDAEKAEAASDEDQGVNAAPTQPVEVSPMPDNH